MIRLIGIDVDGTLLDSRGRLPEQNRLAIHAAVGRGVHVALVTGRSYPFARPVADPLPATVTLIVSNGAIERATDGSTLARRLLPRLIAHAVLDRTRAYRHAAALIFDRDQARQILAETMDWEDPNRQAYWARNQTLIDRCAPLEDALIDDPVEVMFNGAVEDMRTLAALLNPTDRRFTISMTEYVDRNFTLLDVTAPDATKGQALAWRAKQLGLTPKEVMAIGDNFNDLEMLELVGCPIVMGNAVTPLKERGWTITGTQDEGGVAQAIERFILHP